MGLDIAVGFIGDLEVSDPEGAAGIVEELARLNDYLAAIQLPTHREPAEVPYWSAQMYGYSGLHYLRRVAAHLELRGSLPSPGDDSAADDPVLRQHYQRHDRTAGGFFRLFRWRKPLPRGFDHPIHHSDAEGYYLPMDFPEVLFPDEHYKIPGAWSARPLDCSRSAIGSPKRSSCRAI